TRSGRPTSIGDAMADLAPPARPRDRRPSAPGIGYLLSTKVMVAPSAARWTDSQPFSAAARVLYASPLATISPLPAFSRNLYLPLRSSYTSNLPAMEDSFVAGSGQVALRLYRGEADPGRRSRSGSAGAGN